MKKIRSLVDFSPELPKVLRNFLIGVYIVMAIAFLSIVVNWVFFPRFVDMMVNAHPDDYRGESPAAQRGVIAGVLVLRTVVAFTWISSLLYLKKLVEESKKATLRTPIIYTVFGTIAYTVLIFQPAFVPVTVMRSVQAAVFFCLLIYILIPGNRRVITNYLQKGEPHHEMV